MNQQHFKQLFICDGIISADDTRLSDDGFRLTLGPADVDVKVTFRCALITD